MTDHESPWDWADVMAAGIVSPLFSNGLRAVMWSSHGTKVDAVRRHAAAQLRKAYLEGIVAGKRAHG